MTGLKEEVERFENNKETSYVLQKHYFGLIVIFFSPLLARFVGAIFGGFTIIDISMVTDNIIWFIATLTIGICFFVWGLIERFKEKLY